MNSYLFILIFLFLSVEARSQSIFKVVESNRKIMAEHGPKVDSTIKYYRILASDSTLGISLGYPINMPKDFDTLSAIAQLLNFEGDKRICALPINNYNPMSSQIYLGKRTNYSIQVEALFIINQMVLAKPFNYASYPMLVDKSNMEIYSLSGTIVSRAYKAYKEWFEKLKAYGINYIIEKNIMPLDGSGIRWY